MSFKNQLIKALVSSFKPRTRNAGEEKRFLILSTTGLGDTLWGTPAIRALRQCFPASYIGIITSPIGKALLRHNRRIDELFLANDPLLPSLLPLYHRLKSKKITHILNFHTSQRPILPLAAMLGAQEIIGTEGINKGLDFLLSKPLENTPMHEIQRRLHIVEQVGAKTLDSSMELFLSPEDESGAEAFLSSLQFPPYLSLIGLHPGAKDKFKQWPPSHFIELGKRLTQELGSGILITGTPSERDLVESVATKIPGSIPITTLPLLTMAALIQRMNLMITNDTGPMHLAFALKTPTIGLFTPTDPHLCGPYYVDGAQVFSRKPTCTPCIKKKCNEPFCLLQIGVPEVYEAALKMLSQSKEKTLI